MLVPTADDPIGKLVRTDHIRVGAFAVNMATIFQRHVNFVIVFILSLFLRVGCN